jgi:hypothetical protein
MTVTNPTSVTNVAEIAPGIMKVPDQLPGGASWW